jgi:hypothetical protein
MEKKKSPKLTIITFFIVFVLLVAVGLGAFYYINNKRGGRGGSEGDKKIPPEISLNLSSEKKDLESVEIEVNAYTDDEGGITSIILPDGQNVYVDKYSYSVNTNGTYSFSAVGKNGLITEKSIEVTNIKTISAKDPYIPNGFHHIDPSTIDSGYVIEDDVGNQFVWVPVENGQVSRSTSDPIYSEDSNSGSGLINSAARYYGFYIARFEASAYEIGEDGFVAASLPDKAPWTNLNNKQAEDASVAMSTVFRYGDNYDTQLVNSYAWDTTLAWLNKRVKNYSTSLNYGNYTGTIRNTGQTETDIINNICDMSGNVREWTTETNTESTQTKKSNNKEQIILVNRVVRGGSANLNKSAASRTGYNEELMDEYWGFRTVLYKKD